MNIRDLINSNLINLSLKVNTKTEVLKEVANMIDQDNRLNSKQQYYDKLIEREEQFSTGLGYGIAIPHAKTKAVKKPTMTVIKLDRSIEWKAIDDNPVKLVIGLAVPEEQGANTHLKIISKLSMNLMEKEFRDKLMSAKNKMEILNLMDLVICE